MTESIPWSCPTGGNDGWSGSLKDVVRRWRLFETLEEQAVFNASASEPVKLEGWLDAKRGLGSDELSQLAERLSPGDLLPWEKAATLTLPAGLIAARTTVIGQTLREAVDLAVSAGNPAAGGFVIRMDDGSHEWRDRQIVELAKQRGKA